MQYFHTLFKLSTFTSNSLIFNPKIVGLVSLDMGSYGKVKYHDQNKKSVVDIITKSAAYISLYHSRQICY